MSTRGCIARRTKDGFKGVYMHFDNYPTSRGADIWDKTRRLMIGTVARVAGSPIITEEEVLEKFCEKYIDSHPGGWSVFGEICYCHDHAETDGLCELSGNEYRGYVDIEWVYTIDPKYLCMEILKVVHDYSLEDILEDGLTSNNFMPFELGLIDLSRDAPEPNWDLVEDSGYDLRLDIRQGVRDQNV